MPKIPIFLTGSGEFGYLFLELVLIPTCPDSPGDGGWRLVSSSNLLSLFEANIWGLGGLFLGLPVDLLIWSFLRRKNSVGQRQSTAIPAVSFQVQTLPSSRNLAPHVQADRPAVSLEVQARPSRGYRGTVRFIFGVVWTVVFFIGAVLITSMVVVGLTGSDPEQNLVANEMGQRFVPWFFFGSIILAGILTKLGKLPGTRLRENPRGLRAL